MAAEARYHVPCRTNFENPVPKFEKKGRPTSTQKLMLFEKVGESLEDDVEFYTVADFHNLMSKLGDDIYSPKMTQIKLKERYGNSMRLLTRDGKSNIIVLDIDRVCDILSQKWYKEQRKENVNFQPALIHQQTIFVTLKIMYPSYYNFL